MNESWKMSQGRIKRHTLHHKPWMLTETLSASHRQTFFKGNPASALETGKIKERQRRACTEACSKHHTHNFLLRKTVNYNLIVSASCTYWGEKYCRRGPLPSLEVPVSGRHASRGKVLHYRIAKSTTKQHTHTQSQNIKLIHWISTSVEGKKMLDTSFYKRS